MNPAPATARGGRFGGRRRLLIGGGLLLALLAAFVWTGGPTAWCVARARAAVAGRDYRLAERWLDHAERFRAGDGEAAFLRARIARKTGRGDLMDVPLQRAVAAGFSAEQLKREVLYAQAQAGSLPDFDRRLSDALIAGVEPAEVCEAFALGYVLNYELGQALRLLDVWQEEFPNDPQPHFLRGRLREQNAAYDDAEREFGEALRLDPSHAPAAYNLARVLTTRHHTEAALTRYDQAAEALYDPQPALVAGARCLRELRRFAEARARLEQAALSPADRAETAYLLVGDPLETCRSQLPAEAGRLEAAERHWAAAEERFEIALAENPYDWRVRYDLATALRQQGQTAAAADQLERYRRTKTALTEIDRLIDQVDRDPSDVAARLRLGVLMSEHVSRSQGLVWLRSVLHYDPDNADALAALAEREPARPAESPEPIGTLPRPRTGVQAAGP